MSRGREDYVPDNQYTAQRANSPDPEPADPDSPDHATRRSLKLAPDSVKIDRLPKPFRSDTGGAVTVAEAGKTYLKVQRANWNDDSVTTKYERHKFKTYPRILQADRHFQSAYNGVTTAMLTRRLSPSDDADRWLTPWECNEMLHGGSIHRSIRRALDYQLDTFAFEWVAVTAPTRSAGTPHEHIYLWIDDPDNHVTADHVTPALDKHLKHCTNAHEKHHRYRADGTGGAITIQHDPDLRKEAHHNVAKHVIRGNTPPQANTLGAQYLASQLAHLPFGDFYADDRDDPPQALFEGAALAWASPYNWFRASGGFPS